MSVLEDVKKVLRRCRLFATLSDEALEADILPRGRLCAVEKGEVLIAPQQQVDWFSVLLYGRVHISQLFPNGESSLMASLRPPHVLGADLICTKHRRSPYYAAAATPVRLLTFSAELLEPGQLPEPVRQEIQKWLTMLLAHENLRKFYRLTILSQRSLRGRIMVYLTTKAGQRGSSTFLIPYSREELAAYLCVNRSALSRELGRLQREGVIRVQGNQFTLLEQGER